MGRRPASGRERKPRRLQSKLSNFVIFAPAPVILLLAMLPVLFSNQDQLASEPVNTPRTPPRVTIRKAPRIAPRPAALEPVQVTGIRTETDGLASPDELAIDPISGSLTVSEETANRITRISDGIHTTIVSAQTAIYRRTDTDLVRDVPIRSPEGICYQPDGTLYVVEDIPGGRLLRFSRHDVGEFPVGEVIDIPGNWQRHAWESVAVSAMGEILIAGSDVEAMSGEDSPAAFPSGAILFRDSNGDWWIPYQRLFSSFSSVAFSADKRRAVYSCELTGEVGWFDLQTRQPLGGTVSFSAKSPECATVLPNGTILLTEEPGSVYLIDPASNQAQLIFHEEGNTIESAIWDPVSSEIVISDDHNGRILRVSVNRDIAEGPDRLAWAPFQPLFRAPDVPEECPLYLARVLALGGLDYINAPRPEVSFREFTSRVPLIAADARLTPMEPSAGVSDPGVRLQFVVFNPNQVTILGNEVSMPLAGFILKRASGREVKTKIVSLAAKVTAFEEASFHDMDKADLVLPHPATIGVSPSGITTIQFLGLNETPDYSLVLNPRRPSDSYIVVYHPDGGTEHYLLTPPHESFNESNWVIAYSGARLEEWQELSVLSREQAMSVHEETVGVRLQPKI